ncbi:FtsX-like permease family protein [Pyxidicoccus parkwayensis]|uniref:FtsX-like permease family protein n=1 Tax=Pyxidicoccus parkwayensis TaxID=2813578 RepID=A0ABX7NPR0_9BACT|nr:FtsX-like permease family protein [Pyxidicoccus parkwaysis]QSQ19555.1 FtsX-like permease family protein [Pyxidicoccus parkwaysis]
MLNLLRLALRNLFAHRERAVLLLAVTASASGVLVGMMALSSGVAASQREAITTFLSGTLNVGGFFKVHPDTLAPVMGDATRVREVVTPLVPEGCVLRERGRGQATAGAGRRRHPSFIVSVDVAAERDALARFRLREGSLDALSRRRTVALSTTVADRLQVKKGDLATLFAQPVGALRRNALDVEVVAVTEKAGLLGGSAGILVSNDTLRELEGYQPKTSGVLQLVCDSGAEEVMDVDALGGSWRDSLRKAGYEVLPPTHEAYGDKLVPLLREGWRGQRLDVSTWEDESSFLSFVTEGLAALTLLVGLVVLAVVGVGLFVSLSVAVRERTREIGTLRAMGMQRPSVVGLFMLEGLLLGLVGSTLGAIIASSLCALLKGAVTLPEALTDLFFASTLPLEPGLGGAVLAVILVTFAAGLATIVPAARAAKLQPRSAMEAL